MSALPVQRRDFSHKDVRHFLYLLFSIQMQLNKQTVGCFSGFFQSKNTFKSCQNTY